MLVKVDLQGHVAEVYFNLLIGIRKVGEDRDVGVEKVAHVKVGSIEGGG